MGRKKNCRRTPEEQTLHREAVRLRNMTDKQLVEEFHRSKDADNASTTADDPQGDTAATPIEILLQGLSDGKCKGIGGAIAYRVSRFAEELGLI